MAFQSGDHRLGCTGIGVTRTPLRNADGRIYLTQDWQEIMALDVDNGRHTTECTAFSAGFIRGAR